MRCDSYSTNSSTYQFCHGESSRPWFVYALEAPNGHKAEALIFVASAIMFVLGGLLLGLSLFGRLSGRATLNPTVRVFLWASFSLFLPLMSYMFSQAKDEAQTNQRLPFRAQVILIWMLLVELLRKKVDAILVAMSSSPLQGVHRQTLWDAIDQIVRIAWIGYLIYSYVHGFRKPGFIILWVLTLIKAAQRVTAVELAKSSFAVGKNAHLVVGYMAQMMEEEEEKEQEEGESNNAGCTLLRKCWYVAMGEERLKREAGPDGYRVELPESNEKNVVTVGNIWELAEGGEKPDPLFAARPKLKDLCLSFALFKLLRTRFENFSMDEAVATKTRDLILQGLSNGNGDGGTDDDAERVFHVIELELDFLGEYYHSVVPVALSSPWFFVANYVLVGLIVVNQAIMVLFITGNGRLLPVIGCLVHDLVTLSRSAIELFKCLGHKILNTIVIMFSSFNILVSLLLFLTFLLMEAWEFAVYVLSDWFLVSLLCEYARRPKWQSSRWVQRAFGALLRVKQIGRRADMKFNQLSVLDLRRHTPWVMISRIVQHRFLGMPSVPVPSEVKHAIFASLKANKGEPLGNGESVLNRRGYPELLWACESKSITEVILVWHIATSLFEMKNSPPQPKQAVGSEQKVATTLSKYCAYLVAFAPELLPEDREGSERVYKAVKRDVRSALSKKHRRGSETRFERVMKIGSLEAVADKGVDLGRQLVEVLEDRGDAAQVWAVLADLWTELVIYVAPSDNIEGHARALTQGGEFITLLWALVTHAGITRRPSKCRQNTSTC